MPTIPIKWLTDSNANKRYPVTHTKAVFDDNGDDLDTILSGISGSTTLSGLSDTNISSPTNGQILKYDNLTSKWVNSAAPTSVPTPTSSDEGKILSVNSNGEYTLITVVNAENIAY